jgi:uncharacterized protein
MHHHHIDHTHPHKRVQTTFFGKVMFFFALAILISAVGTFVGFAYALPILAQSPGSIWIIFIAELVLIFTSRSWSTKRPLGYYLFALFAFLTGITLAPLLATVIVAYGGPGLVIKALLATGFMFTATAIAGFTTKRELSGLSGFLFMGLIGMIITSVIGIFVPWSNNFEMIFSGIGVIIFSIYTMYDFQRLKHYPEDRYIDAAIHLYLDIFNLFIFILRLVLSLSRR